MSASWLTTTDHKRIGLLYFWTAFVFFLLGGIEALVIRLQLAQPDGHIVSAETYNQLFISGSAGTRRAPRYRHL